MKITKTYTAASAFGFVVSCCCVLAVMASLHRSAACAGKYADSRQDEPQGPCSEEFNDPKLFDFIECSYQASTAAFFCRNTTAAVDCTGYINPITGTVAVCSAYFVTMAGWCVAGTCSYSSVVNADAEWHTDWYLKTTVNCDE
jgi:hypothetical protein